MDVVCLHGLGRTGADWAGVAGGLGRFGEVRAPTLPRDPLRAVAQARRLVAPGAVLVGHSAGAVQALRIAADPAVAPAALVLTGGFFPPARNGRGTAESLAAFARHRVALVRGVARDRSLRGPRHGTGAAMRSMMTLALHPARARALLDGARCPVLVVHARDDHHVPADFAEAAASGRPRWTAHIVASGGHHLHVTHPAEWLAAVVPWLEDRVPAGGPMRSG